MRTEKTLHEVVFNPALGYAKRTYLERVLDDSGNQVGGNAITEEVIDGSTPAGKAEIAAYAAAAASHSKPAGVTIVDAVKVVTDREADRAAEKKKLEDAEAERLAAIEAEKDK